MTASLAMRCTSCGHGPDDHLALSPQCAAARCTCLKYRPAAGAVPTIKVARKTCSKCKTEKPATAFYTDPRNTRTGLNSQCKECMLSAPHQKVYDDSRAVRSRARGRATAQLREKYAAEFERLYQAELVRARAELGGIKAVAPAPDDHGHTRATPLLKPGSRQAGESVLDRVREDVGRCPLCITSHDRGHICPACGTAPEELSA